MQIREGWWSKFVSKSLNKIGIVAVIYLLFALLLPASVTADRAYYDPNSDSLEAWSCTGAGRATGHYSILDKGTRSPATPDKNDYISTDVDPNKDEWGFPTVTESDITSITAYVYIKTGKKGQVILNLLQDTVSRANTTVSQKTAEEWNSAMVWNSPTGDLDTITVSAEFDQVLPNPADARIYAVYLEINYGIPTPTPTTVGVVFAGGTPTPTIPGQTLTPTPIPNYINIGFSQPDVQGGIPTTVDWKCDFSQYDYRDSCVDIYLAAIRNPKVVGEPSNVSDALSGGEVYLFGPNMKSMYLYEGALHEPTFSNISFPPLSICGALTINASDAYCLGDYIFAVTFIRRDTGTFVRTDGKPIENSDLFIIH